jgi:hypothetical protein
MSFNDNKIYTFQNSIISENLTKKERRALEDIARCFKDETNKKHYGDGPVKFKSYN